MSILTSGFDAYRLGLGDELCGIRKVCQWVPCPKEEPYVLHSSDGYDVYSKCRRDISVCVLTEAAYHCESAPG